MSINLSRTTTNSSLSSGFEFCEYFILSVSISSSTLIIRTLLLLPLSILILCLGAKRWREKRSFAAESHSDIFTYNVAILELFPLLGLVCFYFDVFQGKTSDLSKVGGSLLNLVVYGENIFHVLTCAERYLAVVHPITYRLKKNGQGVKIRNISIGCAWLISVIVFIMMYFYDLIMKNFLLCSVLIFTFVVSFFAFSVLCVLKRKGPGEGDRNKAQADQVKQRAFFTILAVTVTLWLWFLGLFIALGLYIFPLLSPDVICLLGPSTLWSVIPSGLVLPLLYLQRAGKLKFCFCRCTH